MIKNRYAIKTLKTIIAIITLFLIFDVFVTCYAQNNFITRIIVENNINVKDYEKRLENYNKTNENEFISYLTNTFWNNEKMIKTFPNIKIEDANKRIIYINSLFPEIQPYYKKIFNKTSGLLSPHLCVG